MSSSKTFEAKCPACSSTVAFEWEAVEWMKGRPETARVTCTACSEPIGTAEMGELVTEFEAAMRDCAKMETFVTQRLGRPWMELADDPRRVEPQRLELDTPLATRRALDARIRKRTLEDLATRFSSHRPKRGQPERYERLRDKAHDLALLIEQEAPASRERSLAFTKLEEAIMHANAAIARHGEADDKTDAPPTCGAIGRGFACTRPRGHEGRHEALGSDTDGVLMEWPNE